MSGAGTAMGTFSEGSKVAVGQFAVSALRFSFFP